MRTGPSTSRLSTTSSPGRGRRGTRSWDPSAIREILRRERYIGVYVHGLRDRIKRGGKRIARLADPAHVMRVPVAEWRIIDEATWEAVRAQVASRGARTYVVGRGTKHALAGLSRCDHCKGGISTRPTMTSNGRVTAYACGWHHKRGSTVCPVTICQPVDEVEGSLVEYMRETVLTQDLVERLVAEIKAEVEQAMADPADSGELEKELGRLRAEQKKYAAALAAAPDVDELVAELRKRSDRIRRIETDLAAANRLPEMRRQAMAQVEAAARRKLGALRQALAGDRQGTREAFLAMFEPGSLRFTPDKADGRKVWAIHGTARIDAGVPLRVTPPGIENTRNVTKPHEDSPSPTEKPKTEASSLGLTKRSGSMAAKLAVMAANALRNYDVDRALELLEQIQLTCDPEAHWSAVQALKVVQ